MAASKSSFSAFNDVDDTVAKPVLGSDGAARWQDFKHGSKLPTAASVAPAIPLKKLDRALGTKSIRDEQVNEAKIRRDAGDREVGAGYTVFKRKSDHEEIAAEKKRKLVLDRVRPDDMPYFLPAETFDGYTFDYVFTTRDNRGTGYYWDGTDSLKKELGQAPTHSEVTPIEDEDGATETAKKTKTKKKKKKKSRDIEHIPESDQFNPMEQIAQAIQRRNQLAMDAPPTRSQNGATIARADAAALGADSSVLNTTSSSEAKETLEPELVAAGWETTKDPNSGKLYYFRRSTNERSWSKPNLPKKFNDEIDAQLPNGWKSTKDPNSGKFYYYHTSGKTSWEKPLS
mmetsp:Transcript_39861/g.83786  ORF Transcript_39861/g.83786 Transcript_39861/m.83786 type:complete len:343 (-) Transcript_39861:134-1162(-)|eukprot:CAMPEP_0183737732 /NCGR_PEP_ID=MMETSP0737-20130205/52765_1 /TAXON_ID=385413 /ORGANISM="Thalassiosira miniscula, Strain CCMP1093" /LENGTH=342 /DNA_ID=CAMNT_0025972089 /DNA_START=63 /DNA_END=1091 /DNA_ORIENTATION=+